MRFANDNLVDAVEQGRAVRRGLGEKSFFDLGVQFKRYRHRVSLCGFVFHPSASVPSVNNNKYCNIQ